MKKILENSRGWFYLYVGTQVLLFVFDILFSQFMAGAGEDRAKTLMISCSDCHAGRYLYNVLYLVYPYWCISIETRKTGEDGQCLP